MLKRAYFKIALVSPSFIQSCWNFAETFQIHSTLDSKSRIQHNRCFAWFHDVINKMFSFVTNKVPFFTCILKYFAFLTQIREKYGIFVIPTKNKVICDTESIYKSILADEACRFTSFSILRHNDVITIFIENMISDLKSEYQNYFIW